MNDKLNWVGIAGLFPWVAMIAFLVFVLFGLSGCATYTPGEQSAGPGQAVYHYKKTAEGCEVIITSAREVPGLVASVGPDCEVDVKADALSGEKLQMQMLGIIGRLSDRIP